MKLQGLLRAVGLLAPMILLCGAGAREANSTALASSANFVVLAPTQRLADKAVVQADAYRREIAREWLGRELRPPARPTAVYIRLDPASSLARTLVGGDGDSHLMWLAGPEEEVAGHLLKHEVAHVVLAARFGNQMPIWANEGIASRYDNARRHQLRSQQLAGFVSIDSWPPLERLLAEPIRHPWTYAAAESLTEFLVARGGRAWFLDFVEHGRTSGWNAALRRHYRFKSIAELQTAWQTWLRSSDANPQAALLSERRKIEPLIDAKERLKNNFLH